MSTTSSDSPPLVRIQSLSKKFGSKTVLDNVSFEVKAGEFIALLGSSGAGKTTLFRCITRLLEADSGSIIIAGKPIQAVKEAELKIVRRGIGLIFQQFNLVRRITALENVLGGRLAYIPTWRILFKRFSRSDRQLALAALDRVGLLAQAYQRADSLSGGQQQRVAIARVLAQQSRIVLADEPVASLDPESAAIVLQTLREIAHERNIAVICSLHQVNLAIEYADRVIGLKDGKVVADLPADELGNTEHNLIYRTLTTERVIQV
jgi:phosphonate transport system ATP-binding protein